MIDRRLLADDAIDVVEAAEAAGVEVRLYVLGDFLRVSLQMPGGNRADTTIGRRGLPIMPAGMAHVWRAVFAAREGRERKEGWG